jgi:hypothetical protein
LGLFTSKTHPTIASLRKKKVISFYSWECWHLYVDLIDSFKLLQLRWWGDYELVIQGLNLFAAAEFRGFCASRHNGRRMRRWESCVLSLHRRSRYFLAGPSIRFYQSLMELRKVLMHNEYIIYHAQNCT